MRPVSGPRPDQTRPLIRRDADGGERTAPSWESLTERLIGEAHAAGAFADLPHRGRPLPTEDETYAGDMAMAFRVLRNAGVAPPWIEADKEARRLESEVEALARRAPMPSPGSGAVAPVSACSSASAITLRPRSTVSRSLPRRRASIAAASMRPPCSAVSTSGGPHPTSREPEPGNPAVTSDADATPWPGADMADDLVAWGRIIELETRGRRSGLPRRVAIGYVTRADGSLAVAATDPETHWARTCSRDLRCRVRDEHGWRDCVATALEGDEHNETVTALVLRYGTPAERLGMGPSFRLACGAPARAPDTA